MVNPYNDNELRRRIVSMLDNDKDIRGYSLNADVVEGEVQLQGIVDTLSEKRRIEELVRQVPGVKGVVNAVSISTDGPITDRGVAFEVSEELANARNVDPRHIGAYSSGGDGVVVLKGQTDDPSEIEAAMEAASKARGVTKVISQVKLRDGEKELGLDEIFHSQVNNDEEDSS